MYIREIKKQNRNSEQIYIYHRLIESVRTPNGPRQRTVLNLGRLDLPKEEWKTLANRIEAIVSGQKQFDGFCPDHIEALARKYAVQLQHKREKIENVVLCQKICRLFRNLCHNYQIFERLKSVAFVLKVCTKP